MSEVRRKKLADLLVNYSTEVQPGEWVGILGNIEALPILRDIYTAVLKAGGHPMLMMQDAYMTREFHRLANEDQINWVNPALQLYYEQADVYIRIGGSSNTRAMSNISGERVREVAKVSREQINLRLDRAARGEFKWVGTLFPTDGLAQEANMSLEEYEDFVYGACFCDKDDPAAEWRKLSVEQQKKVDWLKGKKEVVCKGPNVDLTLSIQDRIFINSDGKRNMPSGEIFTGPVEESVNGWVRFSYPSIVSGRAVRGIELRFQDGKVVEASGGRK